MEDSKYSIYYLPLFKREFSLYPEVQQNKILGFVETFEQHGLADFTRYEGKISPSWSGLSFGHSNYFFAKDNDLWHYHIGLPEYTANHSKYKTSDMVLHFQWPDKGDFVNLVDVYDHHDSSGSFYLPPQRYLDIELEED